MRDAVCLSIGSPVHRPLEFAHAVPSAWNCLASFLAWLIPIHSLRLRSKTASCMNLPQFHQLKLVIMFSVCHTYHPELKWFTYLSVSHCPVSSKMYYHFYLFLYLCLSKRIENEYRYSINT